MQFASRAIASNNLYETIDRCKVTICFSAHEAPWKQLGMPPIPQPFAIENFGGERNCDLFKEA